jgi:23S rRNA (adenine2503-C2)-methyltransferase
MKQDIKNFSFQELKEYLTRKDLPSYCAKQIFSWIYKKRREDFALMTDLSKQGRLFLQKEFYFSKLELLKRETSSDGTEKFLFKLADGYSIETVLIPEGKRFTLCISTQVGCKFNCRFCFSGKRGFKRNLCVSEIINQYLSVYDLISPQKITNIVFMGVGEPLDNFYNILGSIGIFTHSAGLGVGKRRICVSTSGIVPKIKELADLKLGVKLSISLHSPDDKIRSEIMPINKKYPLGELIKAVKYFMEGEKLPVTFEYVLLRGINTSKDDAVKLHRLLKELDYKINLIPYNEAHDDFKPPLKEEIDSFREELKKRKMTFTSRKPRGQDINAACGQLMALWK